MIVDCLEPIELSDETAEGYKNHFSSLGRLSPGLRFLYEKVKRVERNFCKRLPPDTKMVWMGRLPEITNEERNLLECFFQWYAVSVCNFVRMAGWLRYPDKKSEPSLKAYLAKVLSGPLAFRDKVGAHFAASCFQDNLAEKMASVMPQVSWSDTHFYAAAINVFIKHGNEIEGRDSGKMERWSLTEVHEELMIRYPILKVS